MSGVEMNGFEIRKGSADAIERYLANGQQPFPAAQKKPSIKIPLGGTPFVVAEKSRGALGVIELKDVVKGGMRERFDQLRSMGIRTVMITGDNPLPRPRSPAEFDDFLAQATPKDKMDLIRKEQSDKANSLP